MWRAKEIHRVVEGQALLLERTALAKDREITSKHVEGETVERQEFVGNKQIGKRIYLVKAGTWELI